VAIVQRVIDAFNRRDVDAIFECVNADVEWLPAMPVTFGGGASSQSGGNKKGPVSRTFLTISEAADQGCWPAGSLPPLFAADTGDSFTLELLLQADVWVLVEVKFLCGVPSSVQVFVDAPPAMLGAVSAPATSNAGTISLILRAITVPPWWLASLLKGHARAAESTTL
jgi:hypothetical protein